MISRLDSDANILAALGARLERLRLDRPITQAALARQAGVAKRTLERMEHGESVQLTNLLRVMRALGIVERIDTLVPEPALRPLDLLAREGRRRKRAPSKAKADDPRAVEPWTWGEDA